MAPLSEVGGPSFLSGRPKSKSGAFLVPIERIGKRRPRHQVQLFRSKLINEIPGVAPYGPPLLAFS